MAAPDGQIRIIIGMALGRDVETSFGTVEKMAERTGRNVAKALNSGGTAGSGGGIQRAMREGATASDKAARQIESDFAKQIKAAEKASAAEIKAFDKAASERIKSEAKVEHERDQALRRQTRNAEREAARQTRESARAIDQQIAQHERAAEKFASRTSHRAVRFMFPNPIGVFGMASRIGGDVLRGAGVDMSIAGSVGRAVSTQALATQLSNQGYMKGEAGPNGQRVAATTIEAEARATANKQAMDPEAMLRAQTKFVDITGNLNDARAAMPGIAALSGATQTDPEKMAEAWANVSRHIGEVPNKAEKVYGLMKLIAGQGRVGSIEIKDEAKDLGKIAAMADKFGGDRAATIGKLTTLAQLGKAEGGAASSSQAATSIVSFVNTMQSPARIKAMMAAGMKEEDLFNMTGTGKNRVRASFKDPFEIIKKGLEHTGGDIVKFGNMFKSVMAQRATNALVAAYNSGGGRNMGAVDEKIAQFGKEATLTDSQIAENNAERLKTDAAKAQEFQNALDGIISQSKNELAPALTALQGPALKAAEGLSWLVREAAANPIPAIGIAISAAIGRALIESSFRAILEKSITTAMANGSGLQIAGGGLMITIAAATVVMHLIDEDIKDREAKQRKDAIDNGNAGMLENEARAGARGGSLTEKQQKDLTAVDANLEERIKRAQFQKDWDQTFKPPTSAPGIALEHLLHPERTEARNDAQHIGELKTELANNARILDMIRTGSIRVIVANANEIANGGGPKVFAPGREHAPGELPAYLRR